MLQSISVFVPLERKRFHRIAPAILCALFLSCSAMATFAQQAGQRTFASPEDAGSAFFAAMQAPDDQAPLGILGPAVGNDDLDARFADHGPWLSGMLVVGDAKLLCCGIDPDGRDGRGVMVRGNPITAGTARHHPSRF